MHGALTTALHNNFLWSGFYLRNAVHLHQSLQQMCPYRPSWQMFQRYLHFFFYIKTQSHENYKYVDNNVSDPDSKLSFFLTIVDDLLKIIR